MFVNFKFVTIILAAMLMAAYLLQSGQLIDSSVSPPRQGQRPNDPTNDTIPRPDRASTKKKKKDFPAEITIMILGENSFVPDMLFAIQDCIDVTKQSKDGPSWQMITAGDGKHVILGVTAVFQDQIELAVTYAVIKLDPRVVKIFD